ncbi:MAG: hypothetical protein IK068_06420, partial [Lachnospiraceae bacterium]|nr:hypothetical protein [Lachnospiraceae bacterium]
VVDKMLGIFNNIPDDDKKRMVLVAMPGALGYPAYMEDVVNELSEFAPFIKELTMILFWVAITLTVVSLVDYVVKNWTVMFASDKEVKPVTENKTEEAPKFDPNTGEPLK